MEMFVKYHGQSRKKGLKEEAFSQTKHKKFFHSATWKPAH